MLASGRKIYFTQKFRFYTLCYKNGQPFCYISIRIGSDLLDDGMQYF